jgi:hypothetical protein
VQHSGREVEAFEAFAGFSNGTKQQKEKRAGTKSREGRTMSLPEVKLVLNRHCEAASAFIRCGQTAGQLQDRCKQSADDEAKVARGGK